MKHIGDRIQELRQAEEAEQTAERLRQLGATASAAARAAREKAGRKQLKELLESHRLNMYQKLIELMDTLPRETGVIEAFEHLGESELKFGHVISKPQLSQREYLKTRGKKTVVTTYAEGTYVRTLTSEYEGREFSRPNGFSLVLTWPVAGAFRRPFTANPHARITVKFGDLFKPAAIKAPGSPYIEEEEFSIPAPEDPWTGYVVVKGEEAQHTSLDMRNPAIARDTVTQFLAQAFLHPERFQEEQYPKPHDLIAYDVFRTERGRLISFQEDTAP